jgi:hypothetical protein
MGFRQNNSPQTTYRCGITAKALSISMNFSRLDDPNNRLRIPIFIRFMFSPIRGLANFQIKKSTNAHKQQSCTHIGGS